MNSEALTSPQTIIAALYVFALAVFPVYQVISRLRIKGEIRGKLNLAVTTS